RRHISRRDARAPVSGDQEAASGRGDRGGTQVSLRRDVHSAFDQITPSMGGLPERVVQTVLSEGATRRRREKMLFRIRAPLSLVAVFLLIALVAAVFIGGRLIEDWNAVHNGSPAGQSTESE